MRPWLYRIAHNAAIDSVKRRRELPTATLPERPAPEQDGAVGALLEAVALLPERQRQVFVLRELHGLRIDETAAELGLAARQVEQSLFAARNRLAEQLVFGERLGCASVRRLAAGPLDGQERRALKAHVRSCPACRRELGTRGAMLALLPVSSFEWLRGLAAGLAGGAAPAAAKLGAVVATATLAVGVPSAVESTQRATAAAPPVKHRVRHVPRLTPAPLRMPALAATAPTVTVAHEREQMRSGRDGGAGLDDRRSTDGGGGGTSGSDGDATTVPAAATTTAEMTTTSDGGGSSSGPDRGTTTTTTATTTMTTTSSGDGGMSGGSDGGGGDLSGADDGH